MKILTVVGARPQFIKAAPVSKALRQAGHTEFMVHTGQHYDKKMSHIFFNELNIASPDINIAVGSGSHGQQTGKMLILLEQIIQSQKPDWLMVYGDTNSTLAGALAAVKLHIPIAHVESGLRSYNRAMPEEHNRVLTDHCSDLLFCPTTLAVKNLKKEGILKGVHLVGDTMFDAVLQFYDIAQKNASTLKKLGLNPGSYLLATLHRPYNTDQKKNLQSIIEAFIDIGDPIIFPVHPRTRKKLDEFALWHRMDNTSIQLLNPVGYLDMLLLEKNAKCILTDSGGIQKEAYFFGVPCITLRPETEWEETVSAGWNHLVGAERDLIPTTVRSLKIPKRKPSFYGKGNASEIIVNLLTITNRQKKKL